MGKKIENYVLDIQVGSGQFGKVYRAINEKTNQTVAVKIVKIQKFKISPKLQEFTINQIQTLSKIEDTTHVVRFIQILKTANNYYFVYEFCNGGTLEQEIKQAGHFDETKAMNYLKDLLKAFQILARSNIMHRDIKPSNILLHNGVIKLADFGFCKPLKDSRDLSQTMLGSPIYMAPQILKGEIYTMKSDIWSLGVVLYEMLFGVCPFEEKTIAKLISVIDEASITIPFDIKISKKAEELLKRMLIKDQFKRMTWEQLFSWDFSTLKEEQTVRPLTNISNPFSKKTNFTALVTEEVRNRYLTPVENYRLPNNNSTASPHTSGLSNQNQNYGQYDTRKKQNKVQYHISSSDKRTIQLSMQLRNKVSQGITLLKSIIHDNSSKLTVSMCSFLAKRILTLSRQNGDNLRKIGMDKENREKNIEMKKLVAILSEERVKVEEKLLPLQAEYEQIKEPQDILFLKFSEQEGLTQQRQGLQSLVELYDYLNATKITDCSRLSKKQLLQQYQRRIFRKS